MRKLNSKNRLILTLVIIVFLFIILNIIHALRPVSVIVGTIFEYPLMGVSRISSNFFNTNDSAEDYQSLKEENKSLKLQLEDLLLENSQLKLEIDDLEILESQLAFIKENNLTTIPARVVARPVSNIDKKIVINRGTHDRVVIGQAVIIQEGIMVGKISQANYSTSEVTLLTDPGIQVACQIQNKTDSPCLAQGDHGVGVMLDYIPQIDQIDVGQYIVTSGLEDMVPRGLYLGRIESLQENTSDLFKQAKVATLVNFSYFNLVSVVVSKID